MDFADKLAGVGGLDTQPCCSLADTILFSPQLDLHCAIYSTCRNFDQWEDDSPYYYSVLTFPIFIVSGPNGSAYIYGGRLWCVTDILLLFIAFYAGMWGVTYAYRLHHLVNVVIAWLVLVHFSKVKLTTNGILELFYDDEETGGSKQRPE